MADPYSYADDPVLSEAVIPPSIVVGVVDVAEARGIDTEGWFTGTGISRAQLEMAETRLSLRQAAVVLGHALRALPSGPVGLRIGSRNVVASWGILGFALHSCSTGAEAVALGLRLHQAAGSLLDFHVEYGPEEFSILINERYPHAELLAFLCEEACAAVLTLMRTMLGGNLVPTRLELSYPAPPHAADYRRFFCGPVHFDADRNRICFNAELLRRPIPTANRAQLAAAVGAAQQLADPQERVADVISAVEGVLRENLREPMTMPLVAQKLLISERTLHRRLAESGQKFGQIRDRVRLRRARILLRESLMPISAVAAEVGFSDSREFRRAYQRWTGHTPSGERSATTASREPVGG